MEADVTAPDRRRGPLEESLAALVADALHLVEDPEVPVSIVDLGLIEEVGVEGGKVTVSLIPTIVACPGKVAIQHTVCVRVGEIPGVEDVEVRWLNDRRWTPDRVTARGQARMAELGVSARPACSPEDVACPYCGSHRTQRKNDYGAAPCHSQWVCEQCRSGFDLLRGVLLQMREGLPA